MNQPRRCCAGCTSEPLLNRRAREEVPHAVHEYGGQHTNDERCPSIGAPGIYSVKRNEQTMHAVAVGLPPEESDLRTIDPGILLNRLGGGRAVSIRAAESDSADEHDRFWTFLAIGCVCCMLAEVLTLKLFRT